MIMIMIMIMIIIIIIIIHYYYNNIGFARSKRSHVVHFIQSQSEFSQ